MTTSSCGRWHHTSGSAITPRFTGVITEVFGKAGLTNVRAGTQFLRHNAASRMLRAQVPLPTISAVLGHADPESTNQYMSVDQDRLLQCVLEVPEGALEGGRS